MGLENDVSEPIKFESVEKYENKIADLKQRIEELEENLVNTDEQHRVIAEKDKEIKELKASFKGEIVSRLKGKLNYLDKENAKLRTEVGGKDEEIEYKDLEISRKNDEIDELRAYIETLKADYRGELPKWAKDEYKELLERKYALVKEHEKLKTENAALKENRKVDEIEKKYSELIFAVGNKYPNETRHETAKRYIISAEHNDGKGTDKALNKGEV